MKRPRAAFLKSDDWKRFQAQYQDADDRSCGVLLGAYVDNCVAEALLKRMVHKEDFEKDMLAETGPLGSFASRVELLWALGAVNQVIRKELHLLRKIRNIFAHYTDVSTFAEDPIRSWCDALQLSSSLSARVAEGLKIPVYRLKFIASAAIVSIMLEDKATS